MSVISKDSVNFLTIDEATAGQRLDNFLIKILKGVPKSHIHRVIRAGEVRINKKRAKPEYRLLMNDVVRVPPMRVANSKSQTQRFTPAREFEIVYEDDAMLVVNKPSGVAVHGGSGVSFGVIEQVRQARPEAKYLELVHRLDKDTSGLLMIAKKRSALVKLHEAIRLDHPKKVYLALGVGSWNPDLKHVKLPLVKYTGAAGEKMVRVGNAQEGQSAHTIFRLKSCFSGKITHSVGVSALSLLEVTLKTGRTHQIRVHMQASDCPIAGDERYGDYRVNRSLQKIGLKRMFLHAYQLELTHPLTDEPLRLQAPLPSELTGFIQFLSQNHVNSKE